jgi:predicted nucleotidyltransferase
MVPIKPQHQRAIEKLRERFINDPRYLALIVGGSITKGTAREDSDIDCSLVVSDEEWRRREAERDYWVYLTDICDYPGGYAEALTYSLDFLKEVAERSIEVLRSQFVNALVVFSRRPEIEEIVRRIPVFPENLREEKINSFYSQVALLGGCCVRDAERNADPYYLALAASNLVHYAGRLILAYNRMLYTSSKHLMRRVAEAPEKPENFMELMERAVREPGRESGVALAESIRQFLGREIDEKNWKRIVSTYIEDWQWGWRTGRPGLQEW